MSSSTHAIVSTKTDEKCPVFAFKVETRLAYYWISYQKLVGYFLF